MSGQTERRPRPAGLAWAERLLALVAFSLMLAIPYFYATWYQDDLGPKQPVPFSHRFHAGTKKIGCLFCHSLAAHQANAGIPPLQTCMLCHSRIIIHYPQIEHLRKHYESQTPIEWVQVYWLPDFVYFNHQVHLNDGIDCSRCHGDVRRWDRVQPSRDLDMGFCLDCHREKGATHDCFTCHR